MRPRCCGKWRNSFRLRPPIHDPTGPPRPLSVLLSNDDGVYAPGLIALERSLRGLGDLHVIAPNRDRSGVSNSLTLDRPLHAETLPNGFIAVDGTPTDCVHLGTAGLFMPLPERVISGINLGANLGDDVLYSGTVAAAMEARFLSRPAIAFSLVYHEREVDAESFAVAATVARGLLPLIDRLEVPPRTVFNVNIPALPLARIRGLRLTTLGQRLRGENPIRAQNPRGKTVYWIGRAGGPVDAPEGSDFHAVANGYVSITPIHADMTFREPLAAMREALAFAADALPAGFGAPAQEVS